MKTPPHVETPTEKIVASALRLANRLREKAAASSGLLRQDLAEEADQIEAYVRDWYAAGFVRLRTKEEKGFVASQAQALLTAAKIRRQKVERAQAILREWEEAYYFQSEAHLFQTVRNWEEKAQEWGESAKRHEKEIEKAADLREIAESLRSIAQATEDLYRYGEKDEVWEAFHLVREKEQRRKTGRPESEAAVEGPAPAGQSGQGEGPGANQTDAEKAGENSK